MAISISFNFRAKLIIIFNLKKNLIAIIYFYL